jgi:uncharacterized phage infection (PIP) family protein YhgE
MSTIPKEHIPETGKMMAAKKFAEENAKFVADDQSVIMLEKAFIAGYRLATDGREELEKECNQLNSFSIAQTEVITALQSSLKEMEDEVAAKTGYIQNLENLIDKDITFLNEKTEQIRQLESSLKEKDQLIEKGVSLIDEGQKLIDDLNNSLKEKEKENDELKVVSNSLHGLMLNGEQRGYDKAAEEFYNQIESLKAENEGHKEIARARGEAINELQAENERLKWMMEQLSNGEAMNVVRESEGVYSVIFKTPKENS